MEQLSLIANSGIQTFTFRVNININDRFEKHFREWRDDSRNCYNMALLHKISMEDDELYYNERDLYNGGYLASSQDGIFVEDLSSDGIKSLTDEELTGHFRMNMAELNKKLHLFENKWLPVPYFYKPNPNNNLFRFGSFNWSRFKLVPVLEKDGKKTYDVILAFDTRTRYNTDRYSETPLFPDDFKTELTYAVCSDEILLLDFCSRDTEKCSFVDKYIFSIVHPGVTDVSDLRGREHKMSYIASFYLLVDYIAQNNIFPSVCLYKDKAVEDKKVDMIVDIGNSRTTAILNEGDNNCVFEEVSLLKLQDFSNPIVTSDKPAINYHSEPFDMRLAFRRVNYGDIRGSIQFVYPSFVRLGGEANTLIHNDDTHNLQDNKLSTYSSPKRYLWDTRKSKYEWRFMTIKGESFCDSDLHIEGVSEWLNDDGSLNSEGKGGGVRYYSRQSLMTFAIMEMLVQAVAQINSQSYREFHGNIQKPRRLKRLIITCPTTMSELERKALAKCAKNAAFIINKFYGLIDPIDVIPMYVGLEGEGDIWYYDEATCSQLVYMYAEIGHKYKGNCDEFFNLYGRKSENGKKLVVGSLDIGAGTTDLMLCEYSYTKDNVTRLTPDPIFYDSFYHAGDDMMKELVRELVASYTDTDIRTCCSEMTDSKYHQKVKDFFGPNHAAQSAKERQLRRDFNIQVSVPLMNYYLELLSKDSGDCNVRYSDVFQNMEPNVAILEYFNSHFGVDFKKIVWTYKKDKVSSIVSNSFDSLLKKIAAIVYSHSCDIFILSGRPSSLPVIRELFLKYKPVEANRLISLNDYEVGDWYPFGNNTGYIKNPKTVVSVGAMIGYYASEYASFEHFVLDTSKLKEKLKSTINYVLAPTSQNKKSVYCLTEHVHHGDITLNTVPAQLEIRQIDYPTYPTRPLFVVDFNYSAIERRIERNNPELSQNEIHLKISDEIAKIKKTFPTTITLERDPMNKEGVDVIDEEGNEKLYQLRIQSLGTNENYWLDSGIFEF